MLSKTACPDNSGKSRYAGKKIIIYLTIFSLLNLVGCYYQQQMTPEEFDFADNGVIQVTTKDTVYKFKGEDYTYNNDTLFASVIKPLENRTNLRYTIGIPVNKIETIEVSKMNVLGTLLIVVPIVLVILFITLSGDGYSGPLIQ